MQSASPRARLTDIVEAVELVRDEMVDVTLEALRTDKRKQWLVERGIEILSEASRRLPDDIKARHRGIPRRQIAGIGNILRHDYERIAHDVLWRIVRDDLPPLELACRQELASDQS